MNLHCEFIAKVAKKIRKGRKAGEGQKTARTVCSRPAIKKQSAPRKQTAATVNVSL
jgi:hypothetical protein